MIGVEDKIKLLKKIAHKFNEKKHHLGFGRFDDALF